MDGPEPEASLCVCRPDVSAPADTWLYHGWRYLWTSMVAQDQEDNPDLYQRLSVIVCVVPRFPTGRDTLLDSHTVAVLIILLE